MKESKQECAKPPPPPKPNFKNKDFVKWSRAESCKKEDNIVSTEWHDTLKKTEPFLPAYDNKPLSMVYLLSGEYGRIWQKERDEWYKNVFVPKAKEKDMNERRRKIRRAAREAKKAAEVNIRERKERRAKENEAKAKIEAEKAEKLKAKVHKLAAPKVPAKTSKKMKEAKQKPPPEPPEQSQETCPKGWKPVELTLQCECSSHNKENDDLEKKQEMENETSPAQASDEGCTMCEGYVQQLKDIQDTKCNVSEAKAETSDPQEKETKAQ